jgi:hypothetical protein
MVSSCVKSEMTLIGPPYPSELPGCAVDIFPASLPPFPVVNVASDRAVCKHRRSYCIEQLRDDACLAGASVVYGFDEGVHGNQIIISATLARPAPIAAVAAPPQAPPRSDPPDCSPPCSPGFACRAGVCEPQCNPPCEAGEICSRQRTCEKARTGN